MTNDMETGQRVTINDFRRVWGNRLHGKSGVVVEILTRGDFPYGVRIDGHEMLTYFPRDELSQERTTAKEPQ